MWSRRPVGWQDGRRWRDGAEQDALRVLMRASKRTQRADESSAPQLPARLLPSAAISYAGAPLRPPGKSSVGCSLEASLAGDGSGPFCVAPGGAAGGLLIW